MSPGLIPARSGGAARYHAAHLHPVRLVIGEVPRGDHVQARPRTMYGAGRDDVVGHTCGALYGNRESQPDGFAGVREDRRVHTNDLAKCVDEGAARNYRG